MAVAGEAEQAVALHPGDGLATRSGRSDPSRSAIRARSGTMPSSSSSKIVRRYISVVSIRSVTWHSLSPVPDSLLWLRRDLRLADHPALVAASEAASGGSVLPLFVLDPRLWDPAGPSRRAWLTRSLRRAARAVRRRAGHPARRRRRRCCPSWRGRSARQRPHQRRRPRPSAAAATSGCGRRWAATTSPGGHRHAVRRGPGHADDRRPARRTRCSPPSPAPGGRTAGRAPPPCRATRAGPAGYSTRQAPRPPREQRQRAPDFALEVKHPVKKVVEERREGAVHVPALAAAGGNASPISAVPQSEARPFGGMAAILAVRRLGGARPQPALRQIADHPRNIALFAAPRAPLSGARDKQKGRASK